MRQAVPLMLLQAFKEIVHVVDDRIKEFVHENH